MPEPLIHVLTGLTPIGAVFLGITAVALLSIPVYVFAGTPATYFNPRPALHRALNSRAGERLLIEIIRARTTAALALLALAQLLAPSSPSAPKKGAL